MSEQKYTAEQLEHIRSTRRFDLRRIIGGVFVVYGIIVTIVGIADPAADVKPTGGIAINLWTGIGMLIIGIFFLLWDHFNPVPAEDIVTEELREEELRAEGEGHAPDLPTQIGHPTD
ncbi:MAG: hypothetical protein LKF88_03755 [Microbacteriaceae bacterium]|jgi:hypothetical protein|nr:hypothetical protein [Microbacteriaceae bacterium]MCI1207567.1 hypothetical protein [Microbacteriaceae bacterium]